MNYDFPQITYIDDVLPHIEGRTEFVVGESISYANKIKFQHEASFFLGAQKLPFSAPVFREILSANKDATEGKISVSEQGLMKVEFKDDNITSLYYLLRLSD